MSERLPYMPSNGTEGEIFEERWCARCKRDARYRRTGDGEHGCTILAKAAGLGEQPKQWTAEKGYLDATCSAFREIGSPPAFRRGPRKIPGQLEIGA